MVWDEWRGGMDGRVVILIKHLFCRSGRHWDLHKIVQPDPNECFHTHPAWAIRFILSGGYIEEMENGQRRCWWPGDIGLVRPSLSHRIAKLLDGRRSLSLWIRFRKVARVHLRGDGWVAMPQTFRAAGTVLDHEQTGAKPGCRR